MHFDALRCTSKLVHCEALPCTSKRCPAPQSTAMWNCDKLPCSLYQAFSASEKPLENVCAPVKQEPTPNEQLPAVPQTATTPNPTEEGEQVTQKYPEQRHLEPSHVHGANALLKFPSVAKRYTLRCFLLSYLMLITCAALQKMTKKLSTSRTSCT